MKTENKKLEETITFVEKKRSVVKPNLGFMKQLVQFEKDLFGEVHFGWNQYLKELGFVDSESRKQFEL
jgi:hypothetical protein